MRRRSSRALRTAWGSRRHVRPPGDGDRVVLSHRDETRVPQAVASMAAKGTAAGRATALDLAPEGIRVYCVAARQDCGPTAEHVAAPVACASDEASSMLGSTFFMDGPSPSRG